MEAPKAVKKWHRMLPEIVLASLCHRVLIASKFHALFLSLLNVVKQTMNYLLGICAKGIREEEPDDSLDIYISEVHAMDVPIIHAHSDRSFLDALGERV